MEIGSAERRRGTSKQGEFHVSCTVAIRVNQQCTGARAAVIGVSSLCIARITEATHDAEGAVAQAFEHKLVLSHHKVVDGVGHGHARLQGVAEDEAVSTVATDQDIRTVAADQADAFTGADADVDWVVQASLDAMRAREAATSASQDFAEGQLAFQEKRKARFAGR